MKNQQAGTLLTVLVVAVLIVQIITLVELVNFMVYGSLGGGRGIGGNAKYITISATGTASAAPTMGSLYISVTGRGMTPAAATSNLSAAIAQMNSTIYRYVNGNLSEIKTTYYNLYNETGSGYYPTNYKTYNGFIATESITVTIPNTQNVSKAIGALAAINSISVSSASATLSDPQIRALRVQAYTSALQNATMQANILTGNATLTVQNITVSGYNYYPLPYALGTLSSVGATTVPPIIYSGTDSITESITVVFSYKK